VGDGGADGVVIATSVDKIGTSGDAWSSGVAPGVTSADGGASADGGGVGTGVTPTGGVSVAVTVTDGVGESTGRMGTAVRAPAEGAGVTLADGVGASGRAYDMHVINSEPVPPARAASSATLTAAHRMVHPTLVPMAPTP
jgi:hypothetical protein